MQFRSAAVVSFLAIALHAAALFVTTPATAADTAQVQYKVSVDVFKGDSKTPVFQGFSMALEGQQAVIQDETEVSYVSQIQACKEANDSACRDANGNDVSLKVVKSKARVGLNAAVLTMFEPVAGKVLVGYSVHLSSVSAPKHFGDIASASIDFPTMDDQVCDGSAAVVSGMPVTAKCGDKSVVITVIKQQAVSPLSVETQEHVYKATAQ